jgi:hypothetical protein
MEDHEDFSSVSSFSSVSGKEKKVSLPNPVSP